MNKLFLSWVFLSSCKFFSGGDLQIKENNEWKHLHWTISWMRCMDILPYYKEKFPDYEFRCVVND